MFSFRGSKGLCMVLGKGAKVSSVLKPKALSRMTSEAESEKSIKMKEAENCIFCKIVSGKSETRIIYQDDDLIAFPDIRPAADTHVLVIPREHIKDAKSLGPEQKELFERMLLVGEELMKGKGEKISGFHWPPFQTVPHLHLHLIAPRATMGFLSKLIFRPNSIWFVTPEYVRSRIESPPDNS